MEDYAFPKFIPCSDTAFLITLGDAISQQLHHKVITLYNSLRCQLPVGVTALIPTYCAIMVVYDPMVTTPYHLQPGLENLIAGLNYRNQTPYGQVIEVPVCYGGRFGPDLFQVARHCDMTPEEVISHHSTVEYSIFMIGASPGFPFLEGLDPKLSIPYHTTPRIRVPAGSIGIANTQTGIYVVESPGDWQLIGRTPLQLFRPNHVSPLCYQIGDRIRFVPIKKEKYFQIQQKEAP
jgi:inhibitor of KinA